MALRNPRVLDGLGLKVVRSDGQALDWEIFWETNFDEHIYYWARCEVKPQILKEQDTHGRVI
jgi:hypothetical protein